MLSHSVVFDSAAQWAVVRQAPLSMGILQVRIMQKVAMPSSRGSSQSRSPTLQVDSLPFEPLGTLITTTTLLMLVLSRFSRVRLCATPQTAAHQAPLSLGFSRQEHWSGVPLPSQTTTIELFYFSLRII